MSKLFRLVDWDGLSSPGEKGKVKTVVVVIFSIVDQLLTRSLGLEKLPNKQQNFKISFLQINLVVKDQTTYHYVAHNKPHHFKLD